MQIHASTRSKRFKRGAEKEIAAILKVDCDLRDFCAQLHLDAENPADIGILTMLYKHVFGREGRSGKIIIENSEGVRVCTYPMGAATENTELQGHGPSSEAATEIETQGNKEGERP